MKWTSRKMGTMVQNIGPTTGHPIIISHYLGLEKLSFQEALIKMQIHRHPSAFQLVFLDNTFVSEDV